MIALDEQALMCDLAETYGIYDYKAFPPFMVGTFAYGLGANSRIKMKARGENAPQNTILLSIIADRLGQIAYGLGGGKGKKPPLITEMFIDIKTPTQQADLFEDGEAFLKAWNEG